MIRKFLWTICLFLIVGCSGKKQSVTEMNSDTIPAMEVVEDVNIRPADKHVPFYDEIEKYDNNLSSIASGVRFVKLDNDPIFRDVFILDIQQCDSFLFLMEPKHLFMYDATGKFIRQIGQSGQGPGEYVFLNAPLQLDEKKRILYASDGYTSRFLSYDFEGNCLKTIRYANSDWSRAYLLDSTTIAVNTLSTHRFPPHKTKKLILQDYKRKTKKSFPSYLYPVERPRSMTMYGPDNFLWHCGNDFYMLEYGNDTVFQVTREELIPSLILTGDLRPTGDDLLDDTSGKDRLIITATLMQPSAAIFESNRFLIANMFNFRSRESYYAVLDKKTGALWRTGKHTQPFVGEGAKHKSADYFIDDMVSGLPVEFIYNSQGEAACLIAADALLEQRAVIADFVSKHPTGEGKKLLKIVEGMHEEDGSVICFVKLK